MSLWSSYPRRRSPPRTAIDGSPFRTCTVFFPLEQLRSKGLAGKGLKTREIWQSFNNKLLHSSMVS